MVGWKDKQEGSPSRDKFKLLHKQLLDRKLWALDADLELVEKWPRPFIVARLDFKCIRDRISFTEVIAYNEYRERLAPVYIIEAQHISTDFLALDPADHRFNVYHYEGGNYLPDPPETKLSLIAKDLTWEQLEWWESELRQERKKEMRARKVA